MTRRTFATLLLPLAAAGGAALLLLPRTQCSGTERAPAPPASSADVPHPVALSPAERQALERDVAARKAEVSRLEERYVAGLTEREAVEDAQLALLDARQALGELGGAAYHRARADVFQQRAHRLERYVMVGRVSPEDLAIAQLDVARARALAGDPSDYAAGRGALLAAGAKRRQAMVEAGRTTSGEAAAEAAALERRFPPLPGGASGTR